MLCACNLHTSCSSQVTFTLSYIIQYVQLSEHIFFTYAYHYLLFLWNSIKHFEITIYLYPLYTFILMYTLLFEFMFHHVCHFQGHFIDKIMRKSMPTHYISICDKLVFSKHSLTNRYIFSLTFTCLYM